MTRCGTIGCKNDVTHRLTYSFPESRDKNETDNVCAPCGQSYVRRPSLHATLVKLTETDSAVKGSFS